VHPGGIYVSQIIARSDADMHMAAGTPHLVYWHEAASAGRGDNRPKASTPLTITAAALSWIFRLVFIDSFSLSRYNG